MKLFKNKYFKYISFSILALVTYIPIYFYFSILVSDIFSPFKNFLGDPRPSENNLVVILSDFFEPFVGEINVLFILFFILSISLIVYSVYKKRTPKIILSTAIINTGYLIGGIFGILLATLIFEPLGVNIGGVEPSLAGYLVSILALILYSSFVLYLQYKKLDKKDVEKFFSKVFNKLGLKHDSSLYASIFINSTLIVILAIIYLVLNFFFTIKMFFNPIYQIESIGLFHVFSSLPLALAVISVAVYKLQKISRLLLLFVGSWIMSTGIYLLGIHTHIILMMFCFALTIILYAYLIEKAVQIENWN